MTRVNRGAAALAAAFILSPVATAAEEGASVNPVAFNLVPFVSAIVVFGVVFFVLAKFVWPKILGGLEEREKKIRSEVYAAEEARQRAAEAQKGFEKSLAEAREKADRMIEQTRAEQARLAADLRAQADAELAQMRDQARASIEAAKRAAISEIYTEAANLATSVAGRILEREVNAGDQRRLVEESVEQYSRQFAKA